jgi:hypothetical protein
MMENYPKKDIGGLFNDKLQDFSPEGSPDEWMGLDLKLNKLSFYKFQLAQFNIYYAALIGLCFSFSSAVFVDHFFIQKKNAQEEKISGVSIQTADSMLLLPKPSESTLVTKDNLKKVKNPLEPRAKEDAMGLQTHTPLKETKTVSIEEVKEKTSEPSQPIKTKNTVYITKQDTIVVYDTLTIKKRKNRK